VARSSNESRAQYSVEPVGHRPLCIPYSVFVANSGFAASILFLQSSEFYNRDCVCAERMLEIQETTWLDTIINVQSRVMCLTDITTLSFYILLRTSTTVNKPDLLYRHFFVPCG